MLRQLDVMPLGPRDHNGRGDRRLLRNRVSRFLRGSLGRLFHVGILVSTLLVLADVEVPSPVRGRIIDGTSAGWVQLGADSAIRGPIKARPRDVLPAALLRGDLVSVQVGGVLPERYPAQPEYLARRGCTRQLLPNLLKAGGETYRYFSRI